MLKCNDVARLSSDYINRQDLTWTTRSQFKMHLMLCKNCRRFVAQMQLLSHALQQRQPPECADPTTQQVQKWLEAVDQANMH